MGKAEDDAKALADYARAGRPMLDPWPHGHVTGITVSCRPPEATVHVCQSKIGSPRCDTCFGPLSPTATVTQLQPKAEPTIRDEILEMLDDLASEIKSGKVEPSHLIMGWAEDTTVNGQQASSFVWDCAGLNRFEAMGHLHAYACKLANGEGD